MRVRAYTGWTFPNRTTRMTSTRLSLALLAFVAPVFAAPPAAPRGLLLISAESRVEVDREGKVAAVAADAELPAAVNDALASNIRRMRFAPPMKDGHAVAGVTYVSQDACAAPENGAYRFAVRYRGNGPSPVQKVVPRYPRDAQLAGQVADWKVSYDVLPDGSVRLHQAVRQHGTSRRFDPQFRSAIDAWIGAMRFRPEFLDGQAVGTRIASDVEFRLGRPGRAETSNAPDARMARAARNDSCAAAIAARDGDQRDMALNSPFQPLPVN